MRIKILLFLVVGILMLLLFGCETKGQNINQIKGKCPSGISGYGSLLVQSDGNINALPCTGRNFLINGVAIPSPATIITGSGTANYIPRFTASTVLGNTPFSWDGTTYLFQNTALNSENVFRFNPVTATPNMLLGDNTGVVQGYFGLGAAVTSDVQMYAQNNATHAGFDAAKSGFANVYSTNGTLIASDTQIDFGTWNTTSQFVAQLIPTTATGRFRVGDYTTTPTNYIDLNQATNSLDLFAATTQLGSQNGNVTQFTVSDAGQSFSFEHNAATANVVFNLVNHQYEWNNFSDNESVIFHLDNAVSDVIFTVDTFKISQNFAVADASDCADTGTLNGAGTVSITLTTCSISAATSIIIANYNDTGVANVIPLSATRTGATTFDVRGDANATFNYWIINRY